MPVPRNPTDELVVRVQSANLPDGTRMHTVYLGELGIRALSLAHATALRDDLAVALAAHAASEVRTA